MKLLKKLLEMSKPQPEPYPWPGPGPWPDLRTSIRRPIPNFDASFECWAVPNFHIFSSEDPQRIPRSVEIVNGCMRELREFYWDCVEEAGIELNFDNSGKKWEKNVKWTEEKKEFYHNAIHILHYMRQVMAPHFICEDFDVKSYNKFIDIYEQFVSYCQACLNSDELSEINIGAYFEYMTTLFESVQTCFDYYLKNKKNKK